MSTVKQATLNDHVNYEAVLAYADKLDRWAQMEEREERPYLASGLSNAASAVRLAAELSAKATREATDAAYRRLYGERS